jgi:hypothetical protein
MARRKLSITEESADADRIAQMAAKKKAALDALAEVRAQERDMGIDVLSSENPPDGPESGNGGSGNGSSGSGSPSNSPDGGIEDNGEGPEPLTEAEQFEKLMSELSENMGKFEVFRVSDGLDVKVGMFPMSDWEDGARLDSIARAHGGGEFRVKFKRANGLYAKQITRRYDPSAYKRDGGDRVEGPTGPTGQFEKFLELMQRQSEAHRQEMSEMRNMLLQMQLKSLENQGGGSLIKSIGDLKVLKELAGGEEKKSPMDDIKNVLEMVSILKQTELGEPASPMQSALNKAFDILKPLVEAGMAKWAMGQSATPVAQGQIAAQVSPPAPAPQKALPSPAPAVDPEFKQQVQTLLLAAQQGQKAETVGAFILDSIEEKDKEAFNKTMEDPALMGRMIEAEPGLKDHEAWLGALLAAVRGGVRKEEIVAEAAPAPTPSVSVSIDIPEGVV